MSTKRWQSDGDQGVEQGSASEQEPTQALNRREFLRLGALAGAGALLAKPGGVSARGAAAVPRSRIEEMTIAEMQAAMDAGHLTARALVNKYLARYEEMRQDFDGMMEQHNLDAMVAPTGSPAWTTDLINGDLFLGASSSPAATAGYPLITVPAGFTFELPVGITFMSGAYSEPTLIRLAYAFEQATQARQPPKFLRTLDLDGDDATAAAPRRKGAADLMEHITNNRPAIKVPGR